MIHVAIGIISNANDEILITQRSKSSPYGNLWEFPGGKIEEGEKPEAALVRELKEELAITSKSHQFWCLQTHTYPDCDVTLHVFKVEHYEGEVTCMEDQQAFLWVAREQLLNFEFPEGNLELIKRLVI